MDQEAWNTKRKLWHICGCLSMLPVYFLWRGINYFDYWLICLLGLAWLLAGICVTIDIIRLYRPAANQAFKRLPFYGSILRAHEHFGYNASTYCFLAVAILITGLYCGLVSEVILVSAIVVIAIADPLAALVRLLSYELGITNFRFFGFLAFAVATCLLVALIFSFYGGGINWLAIIIASLVTAAIEAYTGSVWQYLKSITAGMTLVLPKFITVIYPDDNFTLPLVLAVILILFGS